MARKVKFDDVVMMERLFEQLSAEDASNGSSCPFRSWEILHELDRQEHRKEYDKSPTRIEQRKKQQEQTVQVRRYIGEHPDIAQELMKKVNI